MYIHYLGTQHRLTAVTRIHECETVVVLNGTCRRRIRQIAVLIGQDIVYG